MIPPSDRACGVILLGASRFPYKKQLEPKPAFAHSKQRVEQVLTAEYLIADRVERLDLFDRELSQPQVVDQVHDFLSDHPDLTDLIIYYCGHGGFLLDRSYYLTLRSTRDGREATTGLLLKQFRLDLEDVLVDKRIYLLLDCCYAASAVSDWLSDDKSVSTYISDQLEAAFSPSGTALLVASSRTSPAVAPDEHETTLFSGHLAEAIRTGFKNGRSELSLSDLADGIKARIRNEPTKWRVMPELHVPRQQGGGDVSRFPLVRNIGVEKPVPAAETPSPPVPWPTLSYSQTIDYRFTVRSVPPAERFDTPAGAAPAAQVDTPPRAANEPDKADGVPPSEVPTPEASAAFGSTDSTDVAASQHSAPAPAAKPRRARTGRRRPRVAALPVDQPSTVETLEPVNVIPETEAIAVSGLGDTAVPLAGNADGARERSGDPPLIRRRWIAAAVAACLVLLLVVVGFTLHGGRDIARTKDPSVGVWTLARNETGRPPAGEKMPTEDMAEPGKTSGMGGHTYNTASTTPAPPVPGLCNADIDSANATPPMGGEFKPVKAVIQPDATAIGMMRNVVLSLDKSLLASAGDDGYIRLWDARTLAPVRTLPQQAKPVYGITFNADATQIASAGYDKTVRLFDVATGRLLKTFVDIGAEAEAVAFSPAKPTPYLLGGFTDGRIGIWNLTTDKLVKEVSDPKGKTVRTISFAPDGSSSFVSTNDGTVWLHVVGRTTQPVKSHSGVVYRAAHSPDGRRIVSVGSDNKINVWRARDLELLTTLEVNAKRLIGVAWADDNARIAVSGAAGAVQLWDVDRRTKLRDFIGHLKNVDVEAVTFLAGGRRFVSAGEDGTLRLWDVEKSDPLLTIVPFETGDYVAYTNEGCYAASNGASRHFKIAINGKPLEATEDLKKIFFKTDGFASLVAAK